MELWYRINEAMEKSDNNIVDMIVIEKINRNDNGNESCSSLSKVNL